MIFRLFSKLAATGAKRKRSASCWHGNERRRREKTKKHFESFRFR